MLYGYLQDSADISLASLGPSPLLRSLFLKEQPGTRQVVAIGAVQCWSWLRPLYRWILESTFEPYLMQVASLSDANLVVDKFNATYANVHFRPAAAANPCPTAMRSSNRTRRPQNRRPRPSPISYFSTLPSRLF